VPSARISHRQWRVHNRLPEATERLIPAFTDRPVQSHQPASVPVRLIGRRIRVLLCTSHLVVYNGHAEVSQQERVPGQPASATASRSGSASTPNT
jgi:hypothetical protein